MTQLIAETAVARKPGTRLHELDATRGLAALLVFMHHVFYFAGPATQDSIVSRVIHALLRRLLDGAAAVDYFFVLSGFVLALPFMEDSRRTLSVPEFVLRRIVRIMPTYWVALVVALAIRASINSLGLANQDPPGWDQPIGFDDIAALAGLIFKDFDVRLVNGPVWSLSVEMQVSLLLPLVIAVLGSKQTRAGSLTILAISMFFSARVQGALLFLPLFVLGVVLARYRQELVDRFKALSTSSTLVLFGLGCALFWNRELQSVWALPDARQEWLSGAGSALFILLVLAHKLPRRSLDNRACHFLGQISYSFYLMHMPFLQGAIFLLRGRGWSDWLVLVTASLCAVAGSVLLHWAIELPSLKWGRSVSRWPVWARTASSGNAL